MNRNRKFSVLILGKLPPPYLGPAIATEMLLRSSLRQRYHLVHLNTQVNKNLTAIGQWSGKKIFHYLKLYMRMFYLCYKHRPDLVLVPISQSTSGFIKDSIFILIAWLTTGKVLIHLRGSYFRTWVSGQPRLVRSYVKIILKRCQGAIVLGEKLKYIFKDYFSEQQIYVVPNGADYDLPARTRSDSSIFQIIYLGNLQPSKGIEDVIQALIVLKKIACRPFQLTVIGNWRDHHTRQRIENLIGEHNLPVIILGPMSAGHKFQHLINADVFVFPPREPEGHPWVILEAMACQLPIITTDQGAITESVIDQVNGFIVPVADPRCIADRLQRLMNDPVLRQTMGRNSRERYLQFFTARQMVDNLSRAFDQAMKS
jgi:glycosyltransferase involved in cell wall biosynthesis